MQKQTLRTFVLHGLEFQVYRNFDNKWCLKVGGGNVYADFASRKAAIADAHAYFA